MEKRAKGLKKVNKRLYMNLTSKECIKNNCKNPVYKTSDKLHIDGKTETFKYCYGCYLLKRRECLVNKKCICCSTAIIPPHPQYIGIDKGLTDPWKIRYVCVKCLKG